MGKSLNIRILLLASYIYFTLVSHCKYRWELMKERERERVGGSVKHADLPKLHHFTSYFCLIKLTRRPAALRLCLKAFFFPLQG